MLRLEAVVTELADVSWQGRSKICRQWRFLGNLEADKGLYDENNDMPYLVHMWWEVMFVGGRNTIAQLKFSGGKLSSVYDQVHGFYLGMGMPEGRSSPWSLQKLSCFPKPSVMVSLSTLHWYLGYFWS